ncbi:endonuclease/exonuclease/phosphatase family protein [Brevibacterium daeguense]|uniref:Endonuclease/exonuclease/phosphatase family protein n=1 Tax=Brevibacterium daeguense TaxID=909936 RepID=A0ABP8EN55_9MICO|nr:endonuclease/exonuclease/phosphatase family protein [Brevibacterium daeguense]
MPDQPPAPEPLAVMCFNLRYPALDRNPWHRRLPEAAALIADASPHLIGTQEGVLKQLSRLTEALPARYAWLGEGRQGGDAGEFTAVIYDSERIAVDAVAVRWLSERPAAAGSISWGARHPRTVTVVDCTDTESGTRIRLLNTHLDHKSERSRHRSAEALRDLAAEASGEVLVTGDFNVAQGSEVHRMLTSGPLLSDAVETCPAADSDISTFHGYRGPKRDNQRIDWILHSPGLVPIRTAVNLHGRGRQYPSDHFPVQADFTVPDAPPGRDGRAG